MEYFESYIDPDLNISVLMPPKLIGNESIQYNGLDYIIIRSEIKKIKNNTSKDYGLIMLGGSIKLDNLKKITNLLEYHSKVKIILGPYTDLIKFENKNENHEYLKNPENLPELMAECNWCITNGGISMLEMIYLRKNILVIPQTNLEKTLSGLMKKNKKVDFFDKGKLPDFTKNNSNRQSKLNILFDGNGALRISNLIKSKFFNE